MFNTEILKSGSLLNVSDTRWEVVPIRDTENEGLCWKKDLYDMRAAPLWGGGRMDVICDEDFYSIIWRKINDCDVHEKKKHFRETPRRDWREAAPCNSRHGPGTS